MGELSDVLHQLFENKEDGAEIRKLLGVFSELFAEYIFGTGGYLGLMGLEMLDELFHSSFSGK